MFRKAAPRKALPTGAKDHRAYIVGDVHGRLDLLDALLAQIHAEIEARPPRRSVLVFVGDLIDRGPDSAGVVERLRTYRHPGVRSIFLLGNHEEVMLRVLAGDSTLIGKWRQFGGLECMASYGADADEFAALDEPEAAALVRRLVPARHVQFLSSFADSFRFGDYLVVHAGIRPGVALDQQLQSDLRWIRSPFLEDRDDHGYVVVHGHTITHAVEERPNRIGIDTGAYATGRLTALAIEGTERWFLDTVGAPVEPLL